MAAVTILGGGAYGTAIATVLAHNEHDVVVWCYEEEVVSAINERHCNEAYFAGVQLSDRIRATTDLAHALSFSNTIFEAIPVMHLRGVLEQAKPLVLPDHQFVVLSKGIEQESLLIPSKIIGDVLGPQQACVVVAGPTFAEELAQQHVSGLTVASEDPSEVRRISSMLKTSYLSPVAHDDPHGVQVCSALKNVTALATGIVTGAGGGYNTRALLFTRALSEIALLVEVMGGKRETLWTLAGIGDLVLTTTGPLSRNVKCGTMLGEGRSIEEIREHLPVLPEGVNTVQSVWQLAERERLRLPVFQGVYRMVFEGLEVGEFLGILTA